MAAELSVAEYSLTGMETKPKVKERDAIERAGISGPRGKYKSMTGRHVRSLPAVISAPLSERADKVR
jgi:hypothetical protein